MWDIQVGERIRKYRGHQTFVNACDIARRGPQLLCSGSDDGTLRVCYWRASTKSCTPQIFQEINTYDRLLSHVSVLTCHIDIEILSVHPSRSGIL